MEKKENWCSKTLRERERETSSGECTWDLWIPFNGLASRSYKFARTDIILRRRFLRKRNITETPRVLKYSSISAWCCIRPCNNIVIYLNSMVKQSRITLQSCELLYAKKCLPGQMLVSRMKLSRYSTHTQTHYIYVKRKANTLEPCSQVIVLNKYWDPIDLED